MKKSVFNNVGSEFLLDNAYMSGTFDTTAGRSKGRSEWVRSVSQIDAIGVEKVGGMFAELGLD